MPSLTGMYGAERSFCSLKFQVESVPVNPCRVPIAELMASFEFGVGSPSARKSVVA